MSLEICRQCEGATGRAGRADDSLYTDNDWGPYCEDCWGDADYWRCITDEKVIEAEQLRAVLKGLSSELAPWLVDCNGLPGVIKTLGESTALHTAQRKALAVIAKAKEEPTP